MNPKSSKFSLALTAALFLGASAARAAETCPSPEAARAGVAATVAGAFAAASHDDRAAWDKVTSPGFYAFDAGQRFDGAALLELIIAGHARGARVEWNVGDLDIHADCAWAWASWINRGAIGDAKAMQPTVWQESAVFKFEGGAWRMVFLHSNRVPPKN